jgi:4'-phosphopantetheinyl transferase
MPLPPPDEVHVHELDLTRPRADALTSAELRRAEQRGALWANTRAALRATLARYLETAPDALTFDETDKPRLEPRSPLRFNLTHSGDRALAAVATEREVGVDIERIEPDRDVARLTRRMFLGGERAATLEASDPVLAYHRHWVAKEAFAKATARGVQSMRSFEVSLDGPEGAHLVHVANDPQEARRWSLEILETRDGYVAALAFEGEATVIVNP